MKKMLLQKQNQKKKVYSLTACNPDCWAEDAEMTWRVEASKVEKYATGIFENYSGLMEIPENSYIVQKSGENTYDFMPSDRGMEYTKITYWTVDVDGINHVTMDLIDSFEDNTFATYDFVLVENPQLKSDADQIFKYCRIYPFVLLLCEMEYGV